MTTDINALRKWSVLDKGIQKKILDNVFCSKCHLTSIVNYDITMDDAGVLIIGECKKCGQRVTRLVEDI